MNKLIAHIIGCGGGASHFLPLFCRMFPHVVLNLQDGDILEQRNLDRQLFEAEYVGYNKAHALAQTLMARGAKNAFGLQQHYWKAGMPIQGPLVLCFADNNTARNELMTQIANMGDTKAVFITAANGEVDAQAYAFCAAVQGENLDPRVRWPEIRIRDASPAYRCTDVTVQEERPQTIFANAQSAMLALHMVRAWMPLIQANEDLTPENITGLPFFHNSSRLGIQTVRAL